MTRPGQPPGTPDPWDTALSAMHTAVDNLGPWLAIWAARTEPDAHARRCAADAMDAIDAALAGLHGIRARLVTETRQADDEAAVRADALLARMRGGPPGREREGGPATGPGRPHHASSPPLPQPRGSAAAMVSPGHVAALLALSDERDRWMRLALDWARWAWRHGYRTGHDAGYRTGYERAVTQWKITAAGMTHLGGPTYAEQDRRRYPPGGRLSWIIPRPGEADGGQRS